MTAFKERQRFKAVKVRGNLTQRAAVFGGDKEDADARAARMTLDVSEAPRWNWSPLGYNVGTIAVWCVMEELEPEVNEYGEVAP